MSDPTPLRHRVVRGGALVCSLTLAALVILNAQFGCDSPASNTPPPADSAKSEPAKTEPTKIEPANTEPAKKDPAMVEPAVDPAVEAAANSAAAPEPKPDAKPQPEPIYMPASKSGGDFGRVQFPGQANSAPTQQQAPQ